MKIKPGDFAALQQAILPLDTSSNRRIYQTAGVSMRKYGIDLMFASGFDTKPLYAYLNDTHIETALRRILK